MAYADDTISPIHKWLPRETMYPHSWIQSLVLKSLSATSYEVLIFLYPTFPIFRGYCYAGTSIRTP